MTRIQTLSATVQQFQAVHPNTNATTHAQVEPNLQEATKEQTTTAGSLLSSVVTLESTTKQEGSDAGPRKQKPEVPFQSGSGLELELQH